MNWKRALNKSWKEILKKSQDSCKTTMGITHFATNCKQRIAVIARNLNIKNYHFGEWKATFIAKKDGGKRPILIPSVGDRIVLKAISKKISLLLKTDFKLVSDCSFAYQKGKSVRDALLQLKAKYSQNKVILKLDIQKFFNHIDKDIVCDLLLKKLHDSSIVDLVKRSLDPTIDFTGITDASITVFDRNGISQGNPVSSILSNLYLYEFDTKMKNENHTMIRYADDMIFIVDNVTEAQKLKEDIARYLVSNRKLTLHPISPEPDAKSAICDNLKKRPLTFLGVIFDGEKLLPTKACINALIYKSKTICKNNVSTEEKIRRIKTSISQWCGYYAFLDIPDNKLISISHKIKQVFKMNNLEFGKIDLVKKMHSIRKKQQNKKRFSILPKQKFRGDYLWLQVY